MLITQVQQNEALAIMPQVALILDKLHPKLNMQIIHAISAAHQAHGARQAPQTRQIHRAKVQAQNLANKVIGNLIRANLIILLLVHAIHAKPHLLLTEKQEALEHPQDQTR